MSLKNLLSISEKKKKSSSLTEERIQAQLQHLRALISFYREYPDLLIDELTGWAKDYDPKHFHFYFYQRIFLRIVMRHKFVYATFPRAYSKSFLSMMALVLRCILYPNIHAAITTGGKE